MSKRKETASPKKSTRTQKKAKHALAIASGQKLTKQSSARQLIGENSNEKEWSMIFRVFDKNGDGHISSDELAACMRSLGQKPLTRKIQKILDECDTDKNGTIELDEWLEYMSRKQIEEKGEYVPEAIVDDRVAADGSRELLIKWKGYSEDENTWEPADHFEAEDLKSYDEEKAGKGKVDTEDDKDEKEKPEKKKRKPKRKRKNLQRVRRKRRLENPKRRKRLCLELRRKNWLEVTVLLISTTKTQVYRLSVVLS
jgi:hypothetical protein